MTSLKISKTDLSEILSLRDLYLQENNCQIRYNACHERNWTDSYILEYDGKKVAYGSVKGKVELADRDAIFEFYVLPAYRAKSSIFFSKLLEKSRATFIESQSNDLLTTSMLWEFGENSSSNVVLFEDHFTSRLAQPGLLFRKRKNGDDVFGKKTADAGEYVLEKQGEIVADGGFLTHYNHPFADLYMETESECRGRGYASFILQEIKKECYHAGKVPAARCNMSNKASRGALLNAGFRVCGYMLSAEV